MLYIVATPIGNLEDVSFRALQKLREADVLACEDTRRTRRLLSRYEIPLPGDVISYREETEAKTGPKLLEYLKTDKTVVLCSDSGYPGISDPGYRIIRSCVKEGLDFEVVPGASAVPLALLYSGLPTSSYTFKGYPPRKTGARMRFFEEEKNTPHSLVVYESPMRIAKTLAAARDGLGDRMAAVCIELTKQFERVHRGYLDELAEEFEGKKVKGEVTLVVAGNNPKFARQPPGS
jgi:16S rRNA (cytidine1402-2'-O)-methyltransferase